MARGRPRKSEIANSSSLPTSDALTPSPEPSSRAHSGFRGVFIPSTMSSKRQSVDTASTYDLDSETPGTSAVGTPNIMSSKGKRGGRAAVLRNQDMDRDAAIAQALQQEEYNVDDSAQGPSASKRRLTDLASDSDDALSSMDSSTDDEPLAKKRKATVTAKKPRSKATNARQKLPSRQKIPATKNQPAPRRAAKMSATNAIKSVVADSDDLSELGSNFSEDDDPFGLAYFDGDSDDDVSGAEDYDEDHLLELNAERPIGRRRGRDIFANGRPRGLRRGLNRAARERLKLEKAHPEILTMWRDLEAVPKIVTEQSQQPESITRTLKSFQLEGLNWLRKQEQTQWKGGLLGDEMGMGKTIQAVSLIMSDYPQKKPTLVVVPPVALMQWTNEIKEYTNGKLNVLVYHGTNSKVKGMTVKDLKKYDVIMISYPGLESIHRKETKGWSRAENIVKEDSAIHAIDFHRLILDEAHSIKSRTTGVAKACFALKGDYKWCLSGTPVQNRIGEFFSLLRFLEVTPFANYFCKSCSCSALHWSVTPDYRCTHCNHRALDHVSVFNQEILNPITQAEDDATRKAAFAKLRLLTDHIMLRRMKRDHTSSMELPPKEVVIHNEFFGEIEKDFANSIMGNTTRTFDTYVSRGVMLNNYANIFGLIMQMRQVANHPDLITKKHATEGQNVLVCNICDEPAEEPIRSRCKHDFCRACAKDFVKACENSGATPDCPRCHIALAIDFEQPDIEQDEDNVKKSSIINRIKMENWASSTKIEMLVYDLWKLRSKKQTTKSIVFSQFTSMLQLIEWRLRRAGFNTVMLDGSMSPQQRQKSIEYFMNNTDVEVFLVSLKAGGVALNLVAASNVILVEPHWNPAAESQAFDRVHRIGQRRACSIQKLIIEDSIESRIVELQVKKTNMINSTINNDDVALDRLTPEDIQFLFKGS